MNRAYDADLLDIEEIDFKWSDLGIYFADLDTEGELCETGYAREDHPECPMGIGDENGLCIKASCGCHYVGCEYSDE